MRKLALALVAASAAVFGFGAVASAQYATSISVGTVVPGGGYTTTYENCVPGETITFTQPESTPTSVEGICEAAATLSGASIVGLLLPAQASTGTATGDFSAAPTAGGTYIVTGVGEQSPELTTQFVIEQTDTTAAPTTAAPTTAAPDTTAAVTVPGSGLPATGSDGIATSTAIAIGLLVAGVALFLVAQVRRREAPTT